MLTNTLNITDGQNDQIIGIDSAHRIGTKKPNQTKPRPIKVMFTRLKVKEQVMNEVRKETKKPNSQISASHDFTERIRKIRKALVPHMLHAKSLNKKSFIRYDKLYIENRMFSIDLENNQLVPCPSRK